MNNKQVNTKKTSNHVNPKRKTIDQSDIYLFKTVVLRALSDETRQGIIVLLGRYGSLCVNDLAAYFNVSRPTVSHHLNVLKTARMIESKKSGKEIFYSLNLRYIRRTVNNLTRIVQSIEEIATKKDTKPY